MKVTLPSQVPMKWVLSFVLVLACVQLVEGTPLILSATGCAFIVVAATAFNVTGGLQYPSGAYIFFNALFSCIVGMVTKALLGEPLQTNLINAQLTLSVYLVGMCSLMAAVLLSSRLRRKTPFLTDRLNSTQINSIAIGCLLLYVLPIFILPAQWAGTYNQFNYFQFLAVMLPVYQLAKETDGRRTFNWISFSVWLYITIRLGIMAFSKEGMFGGSAAWAIAAVAAGYRISLKKGIILASSGVLAVLILTPFSQVGRIYRNEENVFGIAVTMLRHPLETRARYAEMQSDLGAGTPGEGVAHWFNSQEGLLDRLTIVPVDDVLIYVTDHGQPGSMEILSSYWTNLIPRYLYPNKPTFLVGNLYGHEIGALAPEDNSTGVSFSAYADAYHIDRWMGVTVILAPTFFLLFFVADSLVGTIRQTRWSLLYFVWFSHQGAEGLMNALVYGAGTFSFAVILAQAATTRMGPILGAMTIRPGRRKMYSEWTPDNVNSLGGRATIERRYE